MKEPMNMNLEIKITELEKKIDIVLSILGHGRTKSDAEIERLADVAYRTIMNKRSQKREGKNGTATTER